MRGAKESLRREVLTQLGQQAPYFSLETIRRLARRRRISILPESLSRYLTEFTASGLIYHAGRGWYSNIPRRLELDRADLLPLVNDLVSSFPHLNFSAWSTHQINPWMHHLLGKFVTFVDVESQAIPTVWEFLRDQGYDAYQNPTRSEAMKSFSVRTKTVVIRDGGLSRAPLKEHFALPEKVFVDLVGIIKSFPIMDPGDLPSLFVTAAKSGRIEIGHLLHYAARKRLEVKFLDLINPLTPQN